MRVLSASNVDLNKAQGMQVCCVRYHGLLLTGGSSVRDEKVLAAFAAPIIPGARFSLQRDMSFYLAG